MPRLGLEYLTSNRHAAFPFVEDALGLARMDAVPQHGASATIPDDFLTDAMLSVPSEVSSLFLTSIEFLGVDQYRFSFSDQDATVVLTYDLDTSAEIGRYGTYILTNPALGVTVRLLAMTAFKEHLATITDTDEFGTRLEFAAAALDIRPPKLQSLDIYDELPGVPDPDGAGPFDGDVTLVPGYNMEIETGADPLAPDEPDTTVLTLLAIAGAGMGRTPCDEQPEGTYLSMNLTPDRLGNVRLAPDDCYAIEPLQALGQVRIHGNCYACCNCDQYVNVGRAIERLMDRTHASHNELTDLHEEHDAAVTTYNEERFRNVRRVYLRAAGLRGLTAASSGWGAINAYVENQTEQELDTLRVTLDLVGAGIRSGKMTHNGISFDVSALVVVVPLGPSEGAAIVWLINNLSPTVTADVRLYSTIDGQEEIETQHLIL